MRFGSAPLAIAWPWPRWFEVRRSSLRRLMADAGGHRLLADRDMQGPGNFARLVRLERGLLEGADARHGPIEVGQAAEIVARIAHGCRPGGARGLRQEGLTCLNTPQTSTRQSIPAPQATYAGGALDAARMALILDSVTHFPPDARGTCVDCGLAWRRLRRVSRRKGGRESRDPVRCRRRTRAGRHRRARLARTARCARCGNRPPLGADRRRRGLRARGVITFANKRAMVLGVAPGMSAREALERLDREKLPPCPAPPKSEERRFRLRRS